MMVAFIAHSGAALLVSAAHAAMITPARPRVTMRRIDRWRIEAPFVPREIVVRVAVYSPRCESATAPRGSRLRYNRIRVRLRGRHRAAVVRCSAHGGGAADRHAVSGAGGVRRSGAGAGAGRADAGARSGTGARTPCGAGAARRGLR